MEWDNQGHRSPQHSLIAWIWKSITQGHTRRPNNNKKNTYTIWGPARKRLPAIVNEIPDIYI
jgi:hypothetical protein